MFTPGTPKPPGSGRKPGTQNKRKLLKVDEVLARNNINPVEEILKLLPDLKPGERAKVWLELLQYSQAKMKPAEDLPEEPVDVTPEETKSLESRSTSDLETLLDQVPSSDSSNP